MSLVKPNILAEALGITTDALRKRRHRVTKSSKLSKQYMIKKIVKR